MVGVHEVFDPVVLYTTKFWFHYHLPRCQLVSVLIDATACVRSNINSVNAQTIASNRSGLRKSPSGSHVQS
jgi:hypothetical protein